MAIIGGCLGIQGAREGEVEKRQYSNIFVLSIMGFISALISVYVWPLVRPPEVGVFFLLVFVSFPLWITSVIFNTISTVIIIIKRKESIPQKRTKILIIMLIILTWSIITSLFLWAIPIFL